MNFWENQKAISVFYDAVSRPLFDEFNLTKMEFDILLFLNNNPMYDTAADIIKIRNFTKSHVSSTLTELEKKGYISRGYKEGNRRSVHIRLTPMAYPILENGYTMLTVFAEQLFSGFTEKEIKEYEIFFERIYKNANDGLKKEKSKIRL